MRIIFGLIFLLAAMATIIVVALHFFPQLTYRVAPEGLLQGQLNLEKPNWVSSKVMKEDSHYIPPLPAHDLINLAACMKKNIEGLIIMDVGANTLVAYRRSSLCHFMDWIAINSNGEVTSSATMGFYDFGKNREMVEIIRKYCAQTVFG